MCFYWTEKRARENVKSAKLEIQHVKTEKRVLCVCKHSAFTGEYFGKNFFAVFLFLLKTSKRLAKTNFSWWGDENNKKNRKNMAKKQQLS